VFAVRLFHGDYITPHINSIAIRLILDSNRIKRDTPFIRSILRSVFQSTYLSRSYLTGRGSDFNAQFWFRIWPQFRFIDANRPVSDANQVADCSSIWCRSNWFYSRSRLHPPGVNQIQIPISSDSIHSETQLIWTRIDSLQLDSIIYYLIFNI